jgi:predicted ribosomally synthesized peptide with nif11-like leader
VKLREFQVDWRIKKAGGIPMSVEFAKQFIDRMKADEQFAKKFMECRDPYSRRAFEEKEGYDFSAEEAKEARGEKKYGLGYWSGDTMFEVHGRDR